MSDLFVHAFEEFDSSPSEPTSSSEVKRNNLKACCNENTFQDILMVHPRPHLVYFRSYKTICLTKTVDFNWIRTPIVTVEGKHADHLTTTRPFINIRVPFIIHTGPIKLFNIPNSRGGNTQNKTDCLEMQ